MRRLWRNDGLGWVLLALFLSSWLMQTWTGWREFRAEQREHEQAARVFGDDGYVWTWAEATFENWQSEFPQLLAMVALTPILIFKRSPESKDGDEVIKETLARLEHRLDHLAAHQPGTTTSDVA